MKLNRWKQQLVAMGAAAVLCGGTNAFAQSSDAILDLLIKKGIINQREANDVREQLDKDTATAVEVHTKDKVPAWLDRIDWAGDLRLRYEYFDFEDSLVGTDPTPPPGPGAREKEDRTRFRFRLRYGATFKATDWATIGFRLATGDGDPVSTNQTFTDTFRKKPITIDLAYVTLTPPWDWANWLKVTGGKMNNPIWQPAFLSPMVYDGDVTPEGVAEQISFGFGENKQFKVFANAGQWVIEELSGDNNDVYMFDQQAGVDLKFGPDVKSPLLSIVVAGGYYTHDNLGVLAFGDSPNEGNAFGNPLGASNFVDSFEVIYGRGEIGWMPITSKFFGTPVLLTVSGEYLENISNGWDTATADDETTGWTFQAAFGAAKKAREWQVAYQYKHLEADATWDAITDSDWGTGGTDRKGHVFQAAYNIRDWWQIGAKAFITEKISERADSGHNMEGERGEEQFRLQVDTVFKF